MCVCVGLVVGGFCGGCGWWFCFFWCVVWVGWWGISVGDIWGRYYLSHLFINEICGLVYKVSVRQVMEYLDELARLGELPGQNSEKPLLKKSDVLVVLEIPKQKVSLTQEEYIKFFNAIIHTNIKVNETEIIKKGDESEVLEDQTFFK